MSEIMEGEGRRPTEILKPSKPEGVETGVQEKGLEEREQPGRADSWGCQMGWLAGSQLRGWMLH